MIGMPGRLRMAMLGLAVAASLGLFSGMASAHGVGYQESDLRPVALDFFYSTGELMLFRSQHMLNEHKIMISTKGSEIYKNF